MSFFGERKNRYIFASLFSKALNSTFNPKESRITTRMRDKIEKSMVVQSQIRIINFARIAQLVEHDLAKVGVASPSLVSRSF